MSPAGRYPPNLWTPGTAAPRSAARRYRTCTPPSDSWRRSPSPYCCNCCTCNVHRPILRVGRAHQQIAGIGEAPRLRTRRPLHRNNRSSAGCTTNTAWKRRPPSNGRNFCGPQGTIRRDCLDFMIPINQRHLRRVLSEFTIHYNRGRPHSALGPGIPEPPQASVPASGHRHRLPVGYRIRSTSVLGGLHHEYSLEKEAA